MKDRIRIFKFLLVLWALCFGLCAFSYADSTNFAQKKKIEIQPAAKTFRVGEKLVYGVYWMGIHVGEGTIEIKELTTINGREAYHITAVAKSNEFLSAFYKVEDVIDSYVDREGLYTLRFEKHQNEGKYKSDEVVIFDQENHVAYYESMLNKNKKKFSIPPKVHDIISAFYYFRTLDVKPNSKVMLDITSEEKNWKAVLNVMSTQSLEILRKGVHEVFCVEPRAPFKGIISKRSKAWVYFSVDENRMPVMIKFRIPFGFVVGVLEAAE